MSHEPKRHMSFLQHSGRSWAEPLLRKGVRGMGAPKNTHGTSGQRATSESVTGREDGFGGGNTSRS